MQGHVHYTLVRARGEVSPRTPTSPNWTPSRDLCSTICCRRTTHRQKPGDEIRIPRPPPREPGHCCHISRNCSVRVPLSFSPQSFWGDDCLSCPAYDQLPWRLPILLQWTANKQIDKINFNKKLSKSQPAATYPQCTTWGTLQAVKKALLTQQPKRDIIYIVNLTINGSEDSCFLINLAYFSEIWHWQTLKNYVILLKKYPQTDHFKWYLFEYPYFIKKPLI